MQISPPLLHEGKGQGFFDRGERVSGILLTSTLPRRSDRHYREPGDPQPVGDSRYQGALAYPLNASNQGDCSISIPESTYQTLALATTVNKAGAEARNRS